MGGSKAPKTEVPKPPPPQSYINYEGDFLRSSNIYDKGTNTYTGRTYLTPEETRLRDIGRNLYEDYIGRLGVKDPQRVKQIEEMGNAFYNRVKQPLDEEYKRANDQARENFNAAGMLNSTGFEDYRRDNIEKIYQQGLLSASEDAQLKREELYNSDEDRKMQILSFLANQTQADAIQAIRLSQLGLQGLGSANDVVQNQYANQLRQLQLQHALNYQPPRQKIFGIF